MAKIAIQPRRLGRGHRMPRSDCGPDDKISGCSSMTYHRPPPRPCRSLTRLSELAPAELLAISLAHQPGASQLRDLLEPVSGGLRVRSGTGHDAAGLTEPSPPGTVLKMRAKPGEGDTDAPHCAGDPDGPVARA
jgi:hypothetical protein